MAKDKFRANWNIEGATKKPLKQGDIAEFEAEEAKPLVECGALSPVAKAEPAGEAAK